MSPQNGAGQGHDCLQHRNAMLNRNAKEQT
jgi:hypothetical protein